MPVEGALLAKRLYPSAGGLYPVRLYLDLTQACPAGIEPGLYVYHPDDHCLSQVAAAPSTVRVDETAAAVRVHLVGHLPAIAPLYGTWSRTACLLEAGYLGALLEAPVPRRVFRLPRCPVVPTTHWRNVWGWMARTMSCCRHCRLAAGRSPMEKA